MSDQNPAPTGMTLFPPIDVIWNSERSELVVVGTAQLGSDQTVRMGFHMAAGAAQALFQRMKVLLEAVDVDAIATRPRDLQ
ncbi:hypothetical protein [Pseudogemmobacter blasticus]|uniref:hypothetical protein n=1 Tax=Fuscovulum blasticum TaxID=1075 RepID=UPI0011B21F03|nr:hypothetical protein [Fuscovulum blasticum]